MSDYRLEIVNNQAKLSGLAVTLASIPVFALDIETVEWWNREKEKVALLQLAFRSGRGIKVAVIDALSEMNMENLRAALESKQTIKVIHNAAFDAAKLFKHYRIKVSPIYDTMQAARRSGEKKYSLQAQAAAYLEIHLDKSARRSDWSRRPLDIRQIDYAARDAFATLLLYEHQRKRNLSGNYSLKDTLTSPQGTLPLDSLPPPPAISSATNASETQQGGQTRAQEELSITASVLLGIISELPSRYGPEQLVASVGTDRVGIAGWIIDRMLGKEADIDEETAKLVIADLKERKLIRLTETRRLETTEEGTQHWQKMKAI